MALNIDDLRSFVLVATERSVTRAAAQLGVTQQSVSERIRRLEARVDAKLFARMPFGMRPSPAGFRFLPYATQVVALIDEGVVVLREEDLVRIAVQRSVASAVVPALGTFAETDQVDVAITDADSDALAASLLAGEVDISIGVFTGVPGPPTQPVQPQRRRRGQKAEEAKAAAESSESSDSAPAAGEPEEPVPSRGEVDDLITVVAEVVFSDPLVWAAPAGHPLTQRSEPLTLTELLALPVVPGPAGASEAGGVRVEARSALADELADGSLVELTLDEPGWVRPISIAYRSTEHDRPAIVAIRDALVKGHASSQSKGNGHRLEEGSR